MTNSQILTYLRTVFSMANNEKTWAVRLWPITLVVWLLTLTATPIAGWVAGDDTFPLMATLGVIAQTIVSLTALLCVWTWGQLARVGAMVMVGAWSAEALGVAIGFPFGAYHYTDLLQPQIANVPLLIPLAWLMMLPSAWATVEAILPHRVNRLIFAALTGLVFTAWDLYLDPQMVDRELWVWEHGGVYFGIPLINFFGWWLTATLLTLLASPLVQSLPRRRLLAIYTLTWLFQAIGLGVFWGQPAPAFVGFLGMGIFVLLAWSRELGRW